MVGLSCFHPLLPVSGTGTGFGPLSSRERGNLGVVLACCCPALYLWIADQVRNDVEVVPALWIDESLVNLYEILGFQPKGVNALSFSSRKRPAYAGMTVKGRWE